jgi:TP901 family phage tail tape measure protein
LASTSRTVKTSLVAEVSGYIAGYEKAAKVTRDLGSEAEKLAAKKDAINQLGAGLLAIGAVAAVGVGLAVKAFAEFDSAISAVKAATQETTANMTLLREAALDAGASSVFTATEAANAIEELGKAGLTTQQILEGGLDGALALASAGAIGVAEAAQIASIAVKQFGLDGSDVPHVADLLAAGAGKAVGSVDDLGAALGQAGLVANGAGQSIEDTTGVLAAFADAGLLGSDAGTSLKTAIVALQNPTDKARGIMDKYNLSFYDGAGNMMSYAEIAGQLDTKLGHLDDETRNAALAQIFGNDALRSANVLYEQGAAGVQKYVDQTNDSGYAAQVAADRLDNLTGDVEKLGGSFETALIRSGSGANDTLRTLTQTATFLVDTLGSAPTPVLNAGLAIGAVAAATALAGGAALIGVPKFMAFKATLDLLHISGKRAAIGIAATGGALGVATIAIGYFVGRQAQMAGTTAALVDTLDEATGALTKYSREFVKKELAESGAFKSAKEAGVSQRELTDAVLEGGDALDDVLGKIGDNNTFGSFFTGVGIRAGNASTSIRDLRTSVEDSTESWENQKAAGDDAAESTESVADSLGQVSVAAADATGEVQALADAIRDFGAEQFDVERTTSSFYEAKDALVEAAAAVDDLETAANEGASLDVLTEGGRNTLDAMLSLAQSTNDAAAALYANGASADDVAARLNDGRQSIIDTRIALGESADEAARYADNLIATPADVISQVQLMGVELAEQALANLTANRTVLIQTAIDAGAAPGEAKAAYRATGGIIPQYLASGGSPFLSRGTDTVPAMLTPGEFVVNARSTAANLDLLRSINQSPTYVPATERQYASSGSSSTTKTLSPTYQISGEGLSPREVAEAIDFKTNQTLRGF